MIAAVISLAVALALATGAIVYLIRDQRASLKSERASFATEVLAGKAQVAAELAQRGAERERDEARAGEAKAQRERDAANAQLVETQVALAKARKENAREVVDKIRNADDAVAALAELDRLFAVVPEGAGAPVPVVPAGDDHGDAGPAAVRDADMASEAGTRRDP